MIPSSRERATAGLLVPRSGFICLQLKTIICRPLLRATHLLLTTTWGSAALHPRLYAVACCAGWWICYANFRNRTLEEREVFLGFVARPSPQPSPSGRGSYLPYKEPFAACPRLRRDPFR